jgi:hypothetical protein
MEEIKYSAVNINAKALEEQNEKIKKSNTNSQTQKKTSFDPKNYLDLKLKEHEATKKVKVRFLPISATDGTVFFDIITHALKVDKEIAKSGFKSYVCLDSEKAESNEECPICKKSKELFEKAAQARKDGNEALSKSLYKQACSFKKKRTFITRVIDRDHEDEGVKFWRFNENSQGKGIYDILMALYETRKQEAKEDGEEDYSIFDLYNGKDIIINVSKSLIPDGFGGMKETIAYNITDSGNRKPLSKDIDKANAWLNDPKTWKDVYSLKSADYLELVVNGKIPVFSKEKGTYVEKTEFDTEAKKAEEEAATEVLKENYKPIEVSTKPTTAEIAIPENIPVDDTEDDLPF